MSHRSPKRRSLLTRLSLQLVLSVVVPVVIIVTTSSLFLVKAVTDEIAKSAVGQLKVAYGTSQMMEGLVLNTATRISIDSRLERLARTAHFADVSRSPETQFAFMEFLRDLDELIRTDALFHSIHIVVDGVDWVISSLDGVVPRAEFSDRVWLDNLLASDGDERTASARRPHIPPAVATIGSGQGPTPASSNQTLVRLYQLTPYLTTLSGWIVLEIDEREFSRRINSSNFGTEGSIAVLDPRGVYISAVDRSRVGQPSEDRQLLGAMEGSPASQGSVTTSKGDGDHLETWYRPPGSPLAFVGDFSLAQLNRTLGNLRWLTLGLSVAILLVGIVGMSLISVRFFNPVRRMVRELRGYRSGEGSADGNELVLLERALSSLLRQENQLFSTVERQRRLRSEDWVLKVLRGTGDPTDEPLPDVLAGRNLRVGLLLIDGAEGFRASFTPERRRSLLGLLAHMTEHAFGPEFACIAAPWSDQSLAVVLGTLTEEAPDEALARGFEALKVEAAPALKTSLTFCVAPGVVAPACLGDAWATCHTLARQRFLGGRGRLFLSEASTAQGASLLPRREIRNVLALVESGDPSNLDGALDDLAASIRSRPGLGYDNAILIYSQVVSGLIRHLIDLSIPLDQIYGPGCDLQAELSSAETLEDAQSWLRSRLSRAMAGFAPAPVPHRAAAVASFLQENFRRDFGIEEVADHVGLSYSHVRKVFHQEYGDSIVGYVNTLRIEAAKALLVETDQTLEAIARQSGYNNIQSLTRYFKKFAGQTPGEFRAQFRRR